jgi:MFS family permease
VAVIAAAGLGALLSGLLSPGQMRDWGWRVPLLIGCLIVPVLLVLRRGLRETPDFEAGRGHPPTLSEILRALRSEAGIVLTGMGLVTTTTVSFYLITVYTPTFGRSALHLPAGAVLAVTLCVGLSNLVWLPVSGALSDRIGRPPILLASTVALLLLAYPLLWWVTEAPSFSRLLTVELVLSALYGLYNGAMVVFLTELVPARARSAGFSLAYSLAVAIFGGATPLVCSLAIRATGNPAMPGAWLTLAAAIGLLATLAAIPAARRRGVSALRSA